MLLTSRAGSTQFDGTFLEAFVRPGLGASSWVSRTNYPLAGILPNGPDQMMFFVARHYMQDSWHIEHRQQDLTCRQTGRADLGSVRPVGRADPHAGQRPCSAGQGS